MTDNLKILKSNSVYTGVSEGIDRQKVFISSDVLNGIDEFLRSNTKVEMGGVLCGYYNDSDEVYITDFIKAEHTDSTLMNLTFTHKTWEAINKEKDARGGDACIIGWFHSHPGHTVFMSGYDEFIQNNFFDMPYMVSYIYDPLNNERGFFVAEDKAVKKLNGYYIYKTTKNKKVQENNKQSSRLSGGKTILIFFSFGMNVIMLILFFFIFTTSQRNNRSLEMVKIQLNDLKDRNTVMSLKLDSLMQTENLKSIRSFDYVVKPGESLKSISMKLMNDSNKYTEIMKLNNIANEYDIKEGQIIKIPLE